MGASIVIVFTGAFIGGIGLMAHGASVKRQAEAGEKRFPNAKVVQS